MHFPLFCCWQSQQRLNQYPWNGLSKWLLNSQHCWRLLMNNGCWQKMSVYQDSSIMARFNFKWNCFRSDTEFSTPWHIHTKHTGKHGQPKKHIDPRVLHEAFQKGRQILVSVLASILGIDQKTLRACMQGSAIPSRKTWWRACLHYWSSACSTFLMHSMLSCY